MDAAIRTIDGVFQSGVEHERPIEVDENAIDFLPPPTFGPAVPVGSLESSVIDLPFDASVPSDGYLDRVLARQEIEAAVREEMLGPDSPFVHAGGGDHGRFAESYEMHAERYAARMEMDAALDHAGPGGPDWLAQAHALHEQEMFTATNPFVGVEEHNHMPGYAYPQYGVASNEPF